MKNDKYIPVSEDSESRYKEYLLLLTANQARIMGFIRILVPNRFVADDILQETTLLMWEKFVDFREGTNFAAWGISIAKNKILQYYTKQKRQQLMFDMDVIKNLADQSNFHSHNDDHIDALKKCTKKLPINDQNFLELRYIDNLDIKQIAQKLNRSTSSLYRRLAKIHRSLLACVKIQMAHSE